MEARIRRIREKAGLSMADFGMRIGIKAPSVSRLESGRNSPADRTVKMICSEFGISEQWLRTGTGDMESLRMDDPISSMVERYHLTPLDRIILEAYIDLPPAARAAVHNFIEGIHARMRVSERAD